MVSGNRSPLAAMTCRSLHLRSMFLQTPPEQTLWTNLGITWGRGSHFPSAFIQPLWITTWYFSWNATNPLVGRLCDFWGQARAKPVENLARVSVQAPDPAPSLSLRGAVDNLTPWKVIGLKASMPSGESF